MTPAEYLAERDRVIGELIKRRAALGLSRREVAGRMASKYTQDSAWQHSRRIDRLNISIRGWETERNNPRFSAFVEWAAALELRVRFDLVKR